MRRFGNVSTNRNHARLSQPADANQRVPRKNAVSGELPLPDTTNMVRVIVGLPAAIHTTIVEIHAPCGTCTI